jgi:hypothetical protein
MNERWDAGEMLSDELVQDATRTAYGLAHRVTRVRRADFGVMVPGMYLEKGVGDAVLENDEGAQWGGLLDEGWPPGAAMLTALMPPMRASTPESVGNWSEDDQWAALQAVRQLQTQVAYLMVVATTLLGFIPTTDEALAELREFAVAIAEG